MRTTFLNTMIIATLLVGFASVAFGRTWTDATGKHKVEGEFVQAKGEWIQIKTPSGKLLSLKIKLLSLPDQKHIKELLEKTPKPNGGDGAEPEEGPKPERLKPEPRLAKKKGQFRTSFTEPSPRGKPLQVFLRMDKERQKHLKNEFKDKPVPADFYDVTKEQFEVVIPQSYDGELPFGLFVFINRDDNGAPPAGWIPILEKHKLIYIGPHKANNFERRMMSMGMDSVHYATKNYLIDPTRIYVGGFERGGEGACGLALAYPDVFTGAIVQSGAGYCVELQLPPNKKIKPKFQPIDLPAFNMAKKNGRYVFLGVQGDPGRLQTRAVAYAMKTGGFRGVRYSDMPVGTNPLEATLFEKGIQTLDAPLTANLKEKYEQGVKDHDGDRWGHAMIPLQLAACHATDEPFAADAKERYLDLAARYQKDMAAIEDRIKFGDTAKANKLLTDFRKRWNPACLGDVQRLTLAIRQKKRGPGRL